MSEQTLDIRKLMTGKDGQLFITGSDRSQIFLAEVDQFEARINFSNADYQPISSYLSISVPTSYTVTLTFSEAVIRDDVVLKPIYDALASGISPVFEFCGRFRTSSGYNRQVFRECIPDGSVDLMSLKPGNGNSVLAASVVLALMILPTIITISENALRALPGSYYEGAAALGATREEAVFRVLVPAARRGIVTSIVLGMGRAIGETIAVGMVAGNSNILPATIFKSVRTLTVNIVSEMGYAEGLHYDALIATGAVLFVFILLLNAALGLITAERKETPVKGGAAK